MTAGVVPIVVTSFRDGRTEKNVHTERVKKTTWIRREDERERETETERECSREGLAKRVVS